MRKFRDRHQKNYKDNDRNKNSSNHNGGAYHGHRGAADGSKTGFGR